MSQALNKTYDGIIIGAGQHGLVLGSYLARAGLDDPAGRPPARLWRRAQHEGGDAARLLSQPAFDQSFPHQRDAVVHAISGSTTASPTSRRATSSARRTATAPRWCFGRDLEETVANIARFSKKDAATFREWNRRAEEMTARILIPERYAEPLPQAEREALLSRTALGRDFLAMTQPPAARRRATSCSRTSMCKLLFLFKVSLFGTWLTDTLSKTSPMGSVIRAFDLQTGYQLCQGGSFNLARGLMETFIAAGGTYPAAGRASTAS